MIEVVNRHGAPCCGIAPGAVGKVDENNLGVKAAMKARPPLLVPAEAAAVAPEGFDAAAELRALSAEIDRRDRIIGDLTADVRRLESDLAAANALLGEASGAKPADAAPAADAASAPTGRRTSRNG